VTEKVPSSNVGARAAPRNRQADMKNLDPLVDSQHSESQGSIETNPAAPLATETIARRRIRVAGRLLGSLLLGGVAVLGSMLIFRRGLLPLVEAAFHPDPDLLSVLRRTGILLTAVAGYWAFVRWHEKREATELHLRPIPLLLGGASGAAMVALPMAVLFALGIYETVLFRGVSPALLGVAAVIGIAATLEELVYRCLLFRLSERAWGTKVALVVQALVFALQHLGNVEQGGIRDVVTMLVAVTVVGLLWGAVFVLARNLWVAAANHAAWNFTILLSGLPLSGIEDWRKWAPLESRLAGPDWLTGGMFGPESSLLVIASTTIVVVLLLRAARRRGAFFAAAA
jgi:membrane protease YdiL (CAAX protease family)